MTSQGTAYLILKDGEELFGLPLDLVESVIPYREPEAVPYQKGAKLGALQNRGKFMGVLNLATLLGVEGASGEGRSVIAVALVDDAYLGIAVAATLGIARPGELGEDVEALGRTEAPCVERSVRWGERVVHLLDFVLLTELFWDNLLS